VRPSASGLAQAPPAHAIGIGDVGIAALAMAIQRNSPTPSNPGMLTSLRDLRLFGNVIGDDGIDALSEALANRPVLCRTLEALWLQQNRIGDRGIACLVEKVFNGAMVNLKRLLLADNLIGDVGVQQLAKAMGGGALAKLTKLSLARNPFSMRAADVLYQSLESRTDTDLAFAGVPRVELDVFPL